MERRSSTKIVVQRVIECPKCRQTVKVRDVSHFRGHGIRIARWKCSECDREVASDRATDLRDHMRRCHPHADTDSIIPIWGNLEEAEGKGLSGTTTRVSRVDSRPKRQTAAPEPKESASPAASKASTPSAAAAPDDVIDIIIGNPEEEASFLTSSSSPKTPRKLPKSLIRRVARMSPLQEEGKGKVEEPIKLTKGKSQPRREHPKTKAGPETKRPRSTPPPASEAKSPPPRETSAPPPTGTLITRDDVVAFLSTIPREEWSVIQTEVAKKRSSRGETSPCKGIQTRNLERLGVTTKPGTTTKSSTEDTASQTSRQTANISYTQDGLIVNFPCGSTMDLHGPTWMPPAPAPEDEEQ